MGRLMRKLKAKIKEKLAPSDETLAEARSAFEANKPDALKKDIRMISGCQDDQTSADVSNVASFSLPDPAGRAGGACTSTLLNVLYKDETVPEDDLSFTEVLTQMRAILKQKKYTQIPQLTASNPIDVNKDFDLVPPECTGARRAVMIGINYVGHNPGELSGCHNDVGNMKNYIMKVHGFPEENITVLMDDGEHMEPTKENIIWAYKKVVSESAPGDAIFLHYSGHGSKVKDDDGDEDDGFDEVLVPLDYQQKGMIRDDDLYDMLIKDLPDGVSMFSLMDCCHSGTILDLPYHFKADGQMQEIQIDPEVDLDNLIGMFGGLAGKIFSSLFGR